MPIYVYECTDSGKHFDIYQHYTDDPLTVCPNCGKASLRKIWQPVVVHYKGHGWYVKDQYNPDKEA